MKLEALKIRMENQIEAMVDTIIEIEKLEQAEPGRELSDGHQIGASMIMFHILTRSMWKMTEGKGLTQEQKEHYIQETAQRTHEHFLNLYGFDTKKLIRSEGKNLDNNN